MTTIVPTGGSLPMQRPAQDREPLCSSLQNRFGNSAGAIAEQMEAIFDKMDLPLPVDKAIVKGFDGILMALDDYGLVFRLERVTDRINKHPLVLQPLKSQLIADRAIFEICPGVNIVEGHGLTSKGYDKFMRRCGLEFWDNQEANLGVLPQSGMRVVIDRLAVLELSATPEEIKAARRRAGRNLQRELYRDLRTAFNKAWPKNRGTPRPAAFQDALQLCRQKKEEGILVSGWQRQKGHNALYEQVKRGMLADAGAAYAQQTRFFDLSR